MLHNEPSTTQDADAQVGSSGIEDDEVNPGAESPVEVVGEVEGLTLQCAVWLGAEQHADIDVAVRAGRALGRTAEEVDGSHIAGARREVLAQVPCGDLSVHAGSIGPEPNGGPA